MNKEDIQNRLHYLFMALQFSSQQKAMLTSGERIMINQERAQLLHALDYSQTVLKPVSDELEKKLKEIDHLIHVYNFQPLNTDQLAEQY